MAGTSPFFRLYLNAHISLYRLTGGRVGGRLGPVRILLLTTMGNKSKQPRTTPVGYFMDGEDYVITGTNGGQPRHPGWYFNLLRDPHATILVGSNQTEVTAQQADAEQTKRLWDILVKIAPLYSRYRELPGREVPMMILRQAR